MADLGNAPNLKSNLEVKKAKTSHFHLVAENHFNVPTEPLRVELRGLWFGLVLSLASCVSISDD